MDPKGDRLRKIQMGQLKLPESILKSNNIILTPEAPKMGGGGCLEGGPRPRPVLAPNNEMKTASPIIITNKKKLSKVDAPVLTEADIPLPLDSDIPLPSDASIPLPDNIPLPSTDSIPLPKDEDIPLPSNASIPLPADKPPQQERKKIKVSLVHLEPRGDELLCRSCVMKFSRQHDYDTHLQSEEHQQAIKELQEGRSPGTSLHIQRQDKKSPSHDSKASGLVSFSFKKAIGSRITITQPFHRRDDRTDRSLGEVKVLKEADIQDDRSTNGDRDAQAYNDVMSSETAEVVPVKEGESKVDNKLMCMFVKVQSKDDSGKVLDWPKEMIQYTQTEPKLMFSCNPLSFDFSQLFSSKNKKSPGHAGVGVSISNKVGEDRNEGAEGKADLKVDDVDKKERDGDDEKKKSHKKKKKKKHKKHKDKGDDKEEGEKKEGETKVEGAEGTEEHVSKKKKKKKHKKKKEEGEKEEETNADNSVDKKKHKKSKKKKHHSEEEEGKTADDEKKHKRRKKSKKSKKKKKKHHHSGSENEKTDVENEDKKKEKETKKENSETSADESDGEKDKDGKKKKKKKRKHKKKDDNNESSGSEHEKEEKEKIIESADISNLQPVRKRKFPGADSDTESEKIVAKLQALNRTKAVQNQLNNNTLLQKKITKESLESVEKKIPSDRKRGNSESSVNELTPAASKKLKVTPKRLSTGPKDNVPIATVAPVTNIKIEKPEESWSKIEKQTMDNVKSKWDTSDSDMDNALDDTLKKQKVLKKQKPVHGPINKTAVKKGLKSPVGKVCVKVETDTKKIVQLSSSQRSNKSNVSAGSAKRLSISSDKYPVKNRNVSHSPASSHSSRSRSRSHRRRSYSRSSSGSRSRSYSSSSGYSDRDSRHSSRHRRNRRSSSRSYSRSSSRSRSRSYHRRRGRSSSYSDYSRSRSYSSSRSRSRSHKRRRRSYTRTRSRSYSSSSYSRSRSRSRSHRRSRRKARRRTKSRTRLLPLPTPEIDADAKKKVKEKSEVENCKEKEVAKVDPSDIPLPDLSGKKEDEISEEKLLKLKDKKPRTDVGKTVAKLVESLPSDIPLPFSEGATKTVSSDSLPTGPPIEKKETDTGFIGPLRPNMPPPPPPPHGMMGSRFPPNHGPPGPPRPGYGPGHWDHWDGPGPWDGPNHWDGPGHGPRPHFRGMRPPFDHRMRGPYDPRIRGPPPPFMNRPRGPHPYMGPRYPSGPHGPPPEYDNQYTEDEPPKKESPPPLPKEPPKAPSPKPPPPKKKETKEPEQNPNIVIPPEQAEQYKQLQKQAAKHARRQLRKQQKKELGEPDEDSSSSEEEPEEQLMEEPTEEEQVLMEEMQTQLIAMPQQLVFAQPQPASSPSGYMVAVSGSQQILIQKPQYIQAGIPVQAGQPVIAVPQNAMYASAAAAAAGAQPAHIVQQLPSGHMVATAAPAAAQHVAAGGMPVAMHTASSLQHLQQVQQIQQIQQMQQIQQLQQAQAIQAYNAQAIQAHNQAVAVQQAAAAQHAPIIVGNQILVQRIGVRPGL